MKSVALLTVLVVSVSTVPLMGDYKVFIESTDDKKDMDRTYADWHTYVEKRGRKQTAFAGRFEVKQKLEKPLVLWDTYIWSETRGWSNFKMAKLNKMSLCKEEIKEKYYDPYFNGTAKFTFPDCTIGVGKMDISRERSLDINQIIHDIMPQCVYGRFKIICTLMDKNNIVFGGLEMIVRVEPLTEKPKKKS